MYKFQTINTDLGILFKNKTTHVFFGNKKLTKENLELQIPNVKKKYINQKHSVIIGTYPQNDEISDGYQWSVNNFAAVIRTADCLPLIAIDHETHKITNLHCGRVGLTNGILNEFLKITNLRSHHSFFIGPHIETYEIGEDLYLELKSKDISSLNQLEDKYFFTLADYVKDFIKKNFISHQIYQCHINTLTNNSYWSYRRDKGTIDRNLSYAFFEEDFLEKND